MIILANPRSDWNVLRPLLFESIGQTLTMVLVTLVIGGFLGLILGVVLYGTRPGNLFENAVVYRILDIIVNIVRPIPFIIFLAAMQPLTIVVVGTSIGTVAAIFPMVVMCTFATSRLVEQNLVPVDPGVIEAARSMGAGKLTIIRTVLIPEALAPLILAYAFLFIGVLDMSAMAGYIGGGGLGNFAIAYGYQKFDQTVTWTAVIIMIVLVQVVHGIEILHNPLETGVVGLIQGEAGPGPRIGLRADIDGLPIVEDSGLEFSSVNEGVMHGCGHDLHMTGLLGAAFWLAEHRDKFAGSIKILFQPSEETGQGARAMIDAGLVDDVEAIIGTHNNPNYAPGQLAIGVEPMMAGCVKFRVTLHAQGTHAGYPYKGTGPIEALASIILSLQTIVSRNVTPFHPLVLSVTEVHGGHVWNVVPAEAGFQGTVRYFHKSDGNLVGRRFKEVVEHTAEAYGISADVVWDDFQDPLVSDPGLAKAVAADANDYAQLEPIRQSMAGEDFCEFAKVTLPVFAFVGSNGQEGCADWHSPHFVGLDESIPTFVNFYVNTALRVLNELR